MYFYTSLGHYDPVSNSCFRMNPSISTTARGRSNHRQGAGTRQRRQDKHRELMNSHFEEKRQAAFEIFKNDLNYKEYIKRVHDAMVGRLPNTTTEEYSVEVRDKTQVVSGFCDEDGNPMCSETNAFVVCYAGSGYEHVPEPKLIPMCDVITASATCVETPVLDTQVLVASVDSYESIQVSSDSVAHNALVLEEEPTPMDFTTNEDLSVVERKSPEYAPDSPLHSEETLVSRLEAERRSKCIVRSLVSVSAVDRLTPITLHPSRYAVVVYIPHTIKGAIDLDDAISEMPLFIRYSQRRTILSRLPSFGHVYRTCSLEDLLLMKELGFAVIAHVMPDRLAETLNVQVPLRRLLETGVTTYVSVNALASDISICDDLYCLLRHRGRF